MFYYAVRIGKTPGIYTSWDECKAQVEGVPDAKYRKFSNLEEAVAYVADTTPLVSLYTGGVCSCNSGPGGYGYAVVVNDTVSLKGSGGLLSTTNHQMELIAVIEGLKVIPPNYSVLVYSDSTYVVSGFDESWIWSRTRRNWVKNASGLVPNRELWEELFYLLSSRPSVRFVCTKAPTDNKHNCLCDRLAVKAMNDLN